MINKVELKIDGNTHEIPIIVGKDGKQALDISNLYKKTGFITFDPGFKNTAFQESSISHINPETGELTYRGYKIEDLAKYYSFVAVSYLIIFGELPNKENLEKYSKKLSSHSLIHEDMINLFDGFPSKTHPLSILSTMVTSLSSYYPEVYSEDENGIDQVTSLLAKVRTITAFSYRRMLGLPFEYPQTKLPYCSNFLNMMFTKPNKKFEIPEVYEKTLNQLWILYAAHEINTAATAILVVANTRANIFASISAGISSLWGSREGGQNIAAVSLVEHILNDQSDYKLFFERLKKGEEALHSTGFGHSAYNVKSARDKVAQSIFHEFYKYHPLDPVAELAMKIEEYVSKDSYYQENNLYPNLEFYSGIMFHSLGIPKEIFTSMQVIGKLPGWLALWRELWKHGEYTRPRPQQIYQGLLKR